MTQFRTGMVVAVSAAAVALVLPACGAKARPSATARTTTTAVGRADRALGLRKAWWWTAPPPGSAGMPAADGDGIALTTGHEQLFLLDGAGAVRWHADRVGLRDVAPALTSDAVLAATDDGLASYDRATGKRRWEASLGERANTPVIVPGKAVVTTWEGSLVAFDLADGSVRWRTKLGGDALGPAATVAAGGGVVVASFDSGAKAGVVAVDAGSGRVRWNVPVPAGAVSAPAVVPAANMVVLVAADVAAHGLSLDDGSERWRQPTEGAGSPEVPPLAAPGGDVLVGHRLGGMALLDARTGSERWRASSRTVAVRGSPAGPGPNGWFVLPLHDGTVLFAGPDRSVEQKEPPGLVTGVAAGPGGALLIGTGQGDENGLLAVTGW
jgi:outer membrane protein assembly factor BamB